MHDVNTTDEGRTRLSENKHRSYHRITGTFPVASSLPCEKHIGSNESRAREHLPNHVCRVGILVWKVGAELDEQLCPQTGRWARAHADGLPRDDSCVGLAAFRQIPDQKRCQAEKAQEPDHVRHRGENDR